MKLADWLFENSMTPTQLRSMLGIKNRSTVWRYLTGERTPQPKSMAEITRITHGQVHLHDFLDPSPPKCAKIARTASGDHVTVLPWSALYADTAPIPSDESLARISGPIKHAIRVLDGRAWFTPSGVFLLDGRVSDPRRVVTAANEILRSRGEPPIPYPGVEEPS